jgi:hypothetical protein
VQNQKLKIPKSLEGHVLRLQKDIDHLHEKMEEEIEMTALILGIKDKDSREYNILWDFLQNDSRWMIEFE